MRLAFALTLAAIAAAPASALAQREPPAGGGGDKVYRILTADQMESMLKNFNLEYKKSDSKTAGNYFYDYKKHNFSIRLYFYNGKDLMVDTIFKDMPLEKLNEWNTKAKFSRACLHKDDKGPFTALEFNLDVLGGITEGTVRQFLTVFEDELKAFDKFVGGGGITQPPIPGNEKIITSVSDQMVESILNALNHKFKKGALQNNGGTYWDFKSKGHDLRLYNYNGKDLMIDATFKQMPLDKINKYNLDRKFVRCVSYSNNNNTWTALESNLDCAGGVTESIVRHFITVFDEEVAAFLKAAPN